MFLKKAEIHTVSKDLCGVPQVSYPKLLELWQEGLDILGFNSLVERSVLLKSQALSMRRDSPLSKGEF